MAQSQKAYNKCITPLCISTYSSRSFDHKINLYIARSISLISQYAVSIQAR